jgi:hypothetical protein
MVNSRKRNFFILCETPSEIVVTQGDKHMIIYNHYLQHVGSYAPRGVSLNFSELGWEQCQLDHLDQPFSEDEIKKCHHVCTQRESSRAKWLYCNLLF